MKQAQKRGLCRTVCLGLTLCSLSLSAFAASAQTQTVTVSLSNIYDLSYQNNVNSKIATRQLQIFNDSADDIHDALNAAWELSQTGSEYGAVMINTLSSQQLSAQSKSSAKLSAESSKKQAALGGQSMLVSYYSLLNQSAGLKNSRETLARNVKAMNKMKELGLATKIEADKLEQTQKQLDDSISTTEHTISELKSNLGLYIGVKLTDLSIAPFEGEASEQITKRIAAIDYNADLTLAQKNCYKLNMQSLAADDESTGHSSVDTLTLDNLKAQFPIAFEQAYQALKTKASTVKLAEDTYSLSQKASSIAAIKLKFGVISQKEYQDAAAQQEQDKYSLVAAQLDFITAQNTYQAMKDGVWAQ